MSKMILHCNAVEARYPDLKTITLPENHEKFKDKCERYGTVPHHRLVDAVRVMSEHALGRNCIDRETFGVSGGKVYPGARFFGLFRFNLEDEVTQVAKEVEIQEVSELSDEQEIERIANLDNEVPDDAGGDNPPRGLDVPESWNVMEDDRIFPAFAIRNSYDRTMSVSAALGYDCFICDNLALSGEVMFSRKHTKNAFEDVLMTFWGLVQTMRQQHQFDLEYRDAAKRFPLTRDRGFELLGRMAGGGLLTFEGGNKSQLAMALKEWRDPRYEIFAEPTLWSLHNAVTFAQRKGGINKRLETGSNATSVFRDLLGDEWNSKAEEITSHYKNPARASVLDLLDVIAGMKEVEEAEIVDVKLTDEELAPVSPEDVME